MERFIKRLLWFFPMLAIIFMASTFVYIRWLFTTKNNANGIFMDFTCDLSSHLEEWCKK